eukprot:559097-Alexandrium_andersonii.AAC.1
MPASFVIEVQARQEEDPHPVPSLVGEGILRSAGRASCHQAVTARVGPEARLMDPATACERAACLARHLSLTGDASPDILDPAVLTLQISWCAWGCFGVAEEPRDGVSLR